MPHITVWVTSKNQFTLPKRIMAQLDYPSHFKLNVVKGALWLFRPGWCRWNCRRRPRESRSMCSGGRSVWSRKARDQRTARPGRRGRQNRVGKAKLVT